MLDRLDKLVFYFHVECAMCHNISKVSHVVMEEQKGVLICTLCGKSIKVPEAEIIIKASKDLNAYLGDGLNAKFVKLILNDKFVVESAVPAVGH
ncbi:MAG: hypothetical protein GX442_00865 [Candidatus Riflebacteria bacterium]|nr:hypothetical protein [Candidatus Riflebacteria bacterium]